MNEMFKKLYNDLVQYIYKHPNDEPTYMYINSELIQFIFNYHITMFHWAKMHNIYFIESNSVDTYLLDESNIIIYEF
jgi:hypothetical protein